MASMFKNFRKKVTQSALETESLAQKAAESSPEACLEVYQCHWREALFMINKPPDPSDVQSYTGDEIQSILVYAEKMAVLLAAESEENFQQGLILSYVLSENVLERLVQWATSCGVLEVKVKGELLKMCETLVGRARQNLLYHKPALTPILRLLYSSSQEKNHHLDVQVISVLHSVCLSISKSVELLDIFFNVSITSDSTKFLVFSLLIPYVHREGFVGQQAREALLLIMAASAGNPEVALYIANMSDFCPLTAAGLCALYSSLPRKLWPLPDDWHRLERDDYSSCQDVCMFLNSLEFCNAIVQVAHTSIKQQLVAYIYDGFLIPVVGPALHQNSMDEIIASTAYLELMLRHVSEPTLLRAFLRFMIEGVCDEIVILESLIARMNSSTSRLCLVSLSLFLTLVDFECEDAMFKLVYQYLIPCTHVMGSQRQFIGDYDIYGQTAQKFLSLVPNVCLDLASDEEVAAVLASPTNGTYSNGVDEATISHLNRYRSNYPEYLTEAHTMVARARAASLLWKFPYDGRHPPMNVLLPEARLPRKEVLHYDITSTGTGFSGVSGSGDQDGGMTSISTVAAETAAGLEAGSTQAGHQQTGVQLLAGAGRPTASSGGGSNGLATSANESSQDGCRGDGSSLDGCHGDALSDEQKQAKKRESERLQRDLEKVLAFLDSMEACPIPQFLEFLDCIEGSGESGELPCAFVPEDFDVLLATAEHWREERLKMAAAQAEERRSAEAEDKVEADRLLEFVGRGPTSTATIGDALTGLRRQSARVEGSGSQSAGSSPRLPTLPVRTETSPRVPSTPTVGPFLTVLLNKVEGLMQNSLQVNLLLTGLVARLASHPQPLIRSLLLSDTIVFQPTIKSLVQVLDSVKQKVDTYAVNVQNFRILLLEARKYLMSKEDEIESAVGPAGQSQQPTRGRSMSLMEGKPKPSFTDILFRRFKPATAAPESIREEDGSPRSGAPGLVHEKPGAYRFNNKKPTDNLLSVTNNRLETLKTKNAVYCAVVLEEFAKEMAAISQEQAVIGMATI